MELILKQSVENLGEANDLVKVKNGYGRNYLIPKGLAIVANESNKKILSENLKQQEHKAAEVYKSAKGRCFKSKRQSHLSFNGLLWNWSGPCNCGLC